MPRAVRSFIARTSGAVFLLRALMHRSSRVAGITVYGPSSFREAVSSALRLLETDAPDAFAFCARFIDAVVVSRHSGVMSHRRPAIVMLGDWATTVSAPYLASTLAHEAFHCHLYWSHRDSASGPRVAAAIASGAEAERRCVEYQSSVLRLLGGSDDDANHITNQLATEWWTVPWHERTW